MQAFGFKLHIYLDSFDNRCL